MECIIFDALEKLKEKIRLIFPVFAIIHINPARGIPIREQLGSPKPRDKRQYEQFNGAEQD